MRGMVFSLAIGLFGTVVPAAAATVTFHNCSDRTFNLQTYNQDDAVCWIARESKSLPTCGAVTFTCEGQCKIVGFQDVIGGSTQCASLPTYGNQTVVIPNGTNYFLDTGTVNATRGTPDWGGWCVCSEAEMQF